MSKYTVVASAQEDEIEDKVLLREYQNRDQLDELTRAIVEARYNKAVEEMQKNKFKRKRKH